MGIYLAVHSKDGHSERYIKPWMIENYSNSLNIEHEKCTYQVTKNKLFSFAHFTRSDMLYSNEEQTYQPPNIENLVSATLLQGHLWEKRKANVVHDAKSMSSKIKALSPEQVRDDCSGEYSILDIDENRILAFNDRLSIEHIYHAEINGVIFVSNRIRLIQEATHSREVNFETLNWMVTCANTIGEETTDKRIFRLPQGSSLTIQAGKLNVQNHHLYMYNRIPDYQISKQFDNGIEACTNNILNAIKKSSNNNFPIPLSGGKDSRAILALLLNSQYDKKIKAYTNGHESHPDVIVAKIIAQHYNLEHTLTMPQQGYNRKEISNTAIIDKFPRHVFQMDGMLGAWDCQGYKPPSNRLVFAGQVGEVYRGYTSSKYKLPESIDEAANFFHLRKCFDPANILLPEARKTLEDKLKQKVVFYLDHGASLEDIPDLFYVVERIPNFVGTMRRNSGYSGRLITPLYTDELVQLAFSLGKEQRRIDRIHFEMIHRSSKWLTSQPFANDTWPKVLEKYANGTPLAPEGVPIPKQAPSSAPVHWRYRLNESAQFRKMLLDVLLSYSNSDVWNYYDKNNIIKILSGAEKMGGFKLISFYAFLNAFFYSNQIEQNIKIALPKR